MPVVNTTRIAIASTSTGVAPCIRMSRTVRTPSAPMNSRATVNTARRKPSVARVAVWGSDSTAPPGRQQLYRRQAEHEPADVREVSDAAARPRAGQAEGPERDLLGEPEPQHDDGGKLDHGEEQDDEDQGQDPRP